MGFAPLRYGALPAVVQCCRRRNYGVRSSGQLDTRFGEPSMSNFDAALLTLDALVRLQKYAHDTPQRPHDYNSHFTAASE